MKKKLRLVKIEWKDAHSSTDMDWLNLEDVSGPDRELINISVGYLLHDNRKCKVVVPHAYRGEEGGPDARGCGWMSIPTCTVVSITDLVPSKAVRKK